MANIKFTQLPDLGNITPSTIVPVVEANVNYTVTAANLQTYVNSTTGNITANYFIGNGSALTGLPATYSNTNVSAYLQVLTSNVSTTGNITGSYIFGNGSQLTGLPATYGNANVANYLPTFSGNITAQNVSATGDITAGYFIGNGSQITGLYGNSNVANYLPTYTGGFVSLTGNVTTTANVQGDYLLGNIAGTTGGYGNSNVQAVLQTYSGTFTAATISATGNITGNYLFGNGSQITGINVATTYGNSNVEIYLASGNNTSNIITTGNVQGSFVKGNGTALTGLVSSIVAGTGISISGATGAVTITNTNPTAYGNANVAAYLPTYTGNLTAGNISTTGTITGTHAGNGAGLSNIVTSISAGSGISVNASTGAVTITATGNGGGNSTTIVNGTSNVSIPTTNGNINFVVGGVQKITLIPGTVGIQANTGITANGAINCTDLSPSGLFQSSGNVSMTPPNTGSITLNANQAGGGTLALISPTITSGTLTVGASAIFNQPVKTKTGTSTGTAGDIAWDASYIYVCTASNVWKRVAITAF